MDMGAMMGALVLSIIPIVIFYLCCQKHIIEGVVAGAVRDKALVSKKREWKLK